MGLRLQRFEDARVMEWANGGGATREVCRSPGPDDRFDWRISVADVERGGPFSAWPGVDRTIVLCTGNRMIVCVDGRRNHLERHVPFTFSGDSITTCEVLDGPTRDLNVMSDRRRIVVDVEVVRVSGSRRFVVGDAHLVLVALAPTMMVVDDQGRTRGSLDTFDAMHVRDEVCVEVGGEGAVLSARFWLALPVR